MAELLPITNSVATTNAVSSKNPGSGIEIPGEQSGTAAIEGTIAFNPILQQVLASQGPSQSAAVCNDDGQSPVKGEQSVAVSGAEPAIDPGEELRRIMESNAASMIATLTQVCTDAVQVAPNPSVQLATGTEATTAAVAEASLTSEIKAEQTPTQLPASKSAISVDLVEATQVFQSRPTTDPAQPVFEESGRASVITANSSDSRQQTDQSVLAKLTTPVFKPGNGRQAAASEQVAGADLLEMISQPRVQRTGNDSYRSNAAAVTHAESSTPEEMATVPSLQKTAGTSEPRPDFGLQSDTKVVQTLTSLGVRTLEVPTDGPTKGLQAKNEQASLVSFPKADPGPVDALSSVHEEKSVSVPLPLTTSKEPGKSLSPARERGIAFVSGDSVIPEQRTDVPSKRAPAELAGPKADVSLRAEVEGRQSDVPQRTESNARQRNNESEQPSLPRPEGFENLIALAKKGTAGDLRMSQPTSPSAAEKEAARETRGEIREKETESGRTSATVKLQHSGNVEGTKGDVTGSFHPGSKIPGSIGNRLDAAESAGTKTVNLPPEVLSSVQDQIAKAVSLKLMDSASEMKVLLTPETLGEVTIKVRMEEGTMAARIDVSQPNVRTALEANLPQLRDALNSRGIQVERIDILDASYSSSKEPNTPSREKQRGTLKRSDDSDSVEAYEGGRFLGYNTLDYLV